MKRNSTRVLLMSLLLSSAAVAVGNYAYAAGRSLKDTDDSSETVEPYGVPGKATNLSVTATAPKDDGTADVTITFTTPTKYFDSDWYDELDGLNELTSVVIAERSGDAWDGYTYTELKKFENPGIGVELSYVVENVTSGEHTYSVIALNSLSKSSLGSNSYSTISRTIKVGYDKPGYVNDLSISANYPEITLTWSAPTEGFNGGTFRTDGLTYTVTRYADGADDVVVAEDITENTFTDTFEVSKLTSVCYAVYAKNVDGQGYEKATSSVLVGPAYSLPFSETFPDYSTENIWTKSTHGGTFSVLTYMYSSGLKTGLDVTIPNSYDEDLGLLYFKNNNAWYDEDDGVEDYYGDYTSAAISLKDAVNPALTFYEYVLPSSKNKMALTISVTQNGKSTDVYTQTFDNMGSDAVAGWEPVTISLNQFVGGEITINFHGVCPNSQAGFMAFDCITVDQQLANDLFMKDLTATASVEAGNAFEATATVYNKGSEAANNFTVDLFVGDELFDSKTVETLASGESTTVTFNGTATNDFGENVTLTALVSYEADSDDSNNSAEASMRVQLANTPAVTNLKAETADGNVVLTWDTPDYSLPAATLLTEGFESYSLGTKEFDGWTTSDPHGNIDFTDYGLEEADWQNGSSAFMVLDSDALEVSNSEKWFGKAHSGTHYIVSTAHVSSYWSYTRKDYLVSPLLSGNAQEIKFYVVSHHKAQNTFWASVSDYVSVYTSTTTNDLDAFTETVLDSHEITNYLKEGGDYEEITALLPEGTKYFAIMITAADAEDSLVLLDDITYEAGPNGVIVTLLGYDVYEDDTQLNDELVTDNTFTIPAPTEGSHTYSVVAVYGAGESDEAVVELNATSDGLNRLVAANAKAYATAGAIHVVGAPARIYDLAGRTVAVTSGDATVAVAPGTYLVRLGSKVYKLAVK